MRDTLTWLDAHPLPNQIPEQGWAAWIAETFGEGAAVTISNELSQLLTEVDDKIEDTDDLGRYLGQIWPLAKDDALAKSNGVRVMTLASSKGLTVEASILCGLETGLIPMEGADQAEERRLLYVGMTRAKTILYGTWARMRRGPTARAGRGQVNERRRACIFLDNGPVRSVDSAPLLHE